MDRSVLLALAFAFCVAVGPASAQEGTRCLVFTGTADSLGKTKAVAGSIASLREAIDKWKKDNAITGPVTETADKPTPHPYWRSTISPELMLPPDVVSDTSYTLCWKGVVSPVVCSSGARVCW